MKVLFEQLRVSFFEKILIQKQLNSGVFLKGTQVSSLEQELAFFYGSKALCVSSGTQALVLALEAIGISSRDEVLVQANTIAAGALAVAQCGGIPIFMDAVDVGKHNVSLDQVKKMCRPETKALILTHMYGEFAPETKKIARYLKSRGIALIEDCSHAHGLWIEADKKYAGQYGDISCFSLYPTKNLGAIGDAGYLLFPDDRWRKEVLKLRDYSSAEKITSYRSTNARCDEIQACVVRHRLKSLSKLNKLRQDKARYYHNNLDMIDKKHILVPLFGGSIYYQYVIWINNGKRDLLRAWLKSKSIETAIHYPYPEYAKYAFGYEGVFPILKETTEGLLSLPLYPSISIKSIKYVSRQIQKFFEK